MTKSVCLLLSLFLIFGFSAYAMEKPTLEVTQREDVGLKINWKDNNNFKKIIMLRSSASKAVKPLPEKNYTVSEVFDVTKNESFEGSSLVVFVGEEKAGSLNLTGLTANTEYYLDFYYVGSTGKLENNGKAQNIEVFTTAPKPARAASLIAYKTVKANMLDVIWQKGDGKKRLVLMKKGKGSITPPKNGVEYNASNELGKGSSTDRDSTFAIYNGSGTTVVIKDLEPDTYYTFKVCDYNGSSDRINYQTKDVFLNPSSKATLLETPELYKPENIKATSFLSKWKKVKGAETYIFDLASDENFKHILRDFEGMDVGDIDNYLVEDVPTGTVYMRVRAVGHRNHSEDSNVIEIELK